MQFSNKEYRVQGQKTKPMTTSLAIKCDQGIVLACDSLGVIKNLTLSRDKIFKINDTVGLVGAGYEDTTIMLTEHLQKYLRNDKFHSEFEIRSILREAISNFHFINNVIQSTRLGYQNIQLLFNPHALIGVKLENGRFYIYVTIFGNYGENGVLIADNTPIKYYNVLGSGGQIATYLLKQEDRIHSLKNLEINVGIAAYIMREVKDIEHNTDKEIRIAIIDKSGYDEIKQDKQQEYYDKMIDHMYNKLCGQHIEENKLKENLKKFFPYN